jgi:C4-type Zn-finger protein
VGEAKRRKRDIGKCIYCNSTENLSDEHVVPYGLGGTLILYKASCSNCARETSKFERRLLRGHWWPYRQFLGLRSRTSKEEIPDLNVKVKSADGTEFSATLPMAKQTLAAVVEF